MTGYYEKIEKESIEELKKILAKPVDFNSELGVEEFDPWEIFPLYGSYSSAFDDMAIATLTDILEGTYNAPKDYELASEMFREMLCKKELCGYGTSPRSCWANQSFKDLLPGYIEKWKQYYKLNWGTEYEPLDTQ